jgi:hypothetical protein
MLIKHSSKTSRERYCTIIRRPSKRADAIGSARGKENIREIFYSMAAIITLAGLAASVVIYLLADGRNLAIE